MITEAINRVIELSNAENRIVKAPDYQRSGRYFLLGSDGTFEDRFDHFPMPEATFHSTASLVAALEQDAVDEDTEPGELPVRVYYDREGITAVVDFGDRRWKRNLPLPTHPVFRRLVQLTRTEAFTQKQLIRFFRAELNGHVDETIIEQFRTLKLTASSDGHSVVAKGREGVDRSIQKEVLAATGAEVPDEISVDVPVYDLDELRDTTQTVLLLIDVAQDDAGQAVFEVTTVLNSLREAEFDTLDQIAGALEGTLWDGAVLLHGKPS